MKSLIAIDPGNQYSGICLINAADYRPLKAGKTDNWEIMRDLMFPQDRENIRVVIEMIGHYGTGMPAGRSIFDTCVWIGRFMQFFNERGIEAELMMRTEVKMHLCSHPRANDATIKQALIDRFAPNERNYGKGTKKTPGFFYGFAADMWAAYGLGVTYLDKLKEAGGNRLAACGEFDLLYPC